MKEFVDEKDNTFGNKFPDTLGDIFLLSDVVAILWILVMCLSMTSNSDKILISLILVVDSTISLFVYVQYETF
jgi:hypothetical protein